MYSENQIDILIASQYVIANAGCVSDVSKVINLLKRQVSISLICQLLLHSLPSLVCDAALIDSIELLFENIVDEGKDDYIVDVSSFFEPKEAPELVFQLTNLTINKKKELVEKFIESVQTSVNKYNLNTAEISFESFMKSLILRLNDEFTSVLVTNPLINKLKTARFTNSCLIDWINHFYIPLSLLEQYKKDIHYSLLDYQNLISCSEIIEIAMSGKDNLTSIINDVLVPYSKYLGDCFWIAFQSWLQSFVKFSLFEQSKLATSYQSLLNILTQDQFMNELSTTKYLNPCVRLILSMIYLTPPSDLQVLINIKEILVLLKSLNIQDGEVTELLILSDFDSVVTNLQPTRSSINLMISIVEINETLYHNDLCFVDILKLKKANKEAQIGQLLKYIENEVSIKTPSAKWKLFLTSTYATLRKTEIFNQISTELFSEVIFIKLLDQKRFEIIETVFNKEFNYLSKERYCELVEKKCWDLYMTTLNNLDDCKNCLQLLDDTSKVYKQLDLLIRANEKIKDWKFYLKPGTHATPKDIYDVKNPFVIIRKIFELNDNAFMYLGDLYHILELLIDGMGVTLETPMYQHLKTYDDPSNLLAVKLKLICFEFTCPTEYTFSFDLAFKLIDQAIQQSEGIFEIISENWLIFFQLAKTEYDADQLELLDNKLKVLSKLLLVTPTEFNTIVLEQWQMLNSQKQTIIDDQQQLKHQQRSSDHDESLIVSLGDVQSRLQRSLKQSADGLINQSTSDLGKNIIGWIVGAN